MGPLSLEDGASGPSRPAVRTHRSPWSDSEGTSNGTSPSAKRDRSLSRSPRFSEEYYRGATDDEEDIADPEAREKRRRFLEARKRHYRMKEPLNM